MTPEHIQKQMADAFRSAADKIDPTLNQVGETPKPETTEAAQDAHQEALESYNTKRVGGARHSHCGAPISEAEIQQVFETPKPKQNEGDA